MNKSFVQAVKEQETRTENLMRAYKSTTNPIVDFFYSAGAARGQNIIPKFTAAFEHDKELALRTSLWLRDIRDGAGERQLFRDILSHLEKTDKDACIKLVQKAHLMGRWDDAQHLTEDDVKLVYFNMLKTAIENKDGLAAKWIGIKSEFGRQFRDFLGYSPKKFRKTIVGLRNVVETKMCAKQWNEINYSHVPSVASKRYRKAFYRNDKERFEGYVKALVKGETFEGKEVKINASAIFPHDVIRGHVYGGYGSYKNTKSKTELDVMVQQWNALPNYIADGNILPLVDVSGSMTSRVDKSGLMAIEVAVSLGLYCSDKNMGKFKDTFLTFSGTPELLHLNGDILAKINQMVNSKWGMNTNLHAAFDKILSVAKQGNVPQEEMPETLLILSDMQFDQCVSFDDSAIEMIRRKYNESGYDLPNVVFWNLNSRDNVPVRVNEKGVALVSGFSPSILKALLENDTEQFTPYGICMKTIMNPKYDI